MDTAPPPNGNTPPRPTSPAEVIALGRLAASALTAGLIPTPRDLLAGLAAGPPLPTTGEPSITETVSDLGEGAAALLGAASALDAKSTAGMVAEDIVGRAAAVERAAEHLDLGAAADAPLLLDTMADGLDVLGYPDDEPIAGCPGTGGGAWCGRIVPCGGKLCRGCGEAEAGGGGNGDGRGAS